MNWQPYDEGKTIGQTGREGGLIILDEEYAGATRIVLEEHCLRAPYAINATVYGYLLHTRFLADDETAQYAIHDMKAALATIADLMPAENDPDEADRLDQMNTKIEAFARDFP
ncbi:MAG: hypothetical protein CL610_23045 [Anaerolineaceae bacterium]|nr:hypothetical protein [Anaerolineaceae bacterium]